MKKLKTSLARRALGAPIVSLAALAWLAVSNHCTLAVLGGSAEMIATPTCHGIHDSHTPANQKKQTDVECCKVLRATLMTLPKNLAPTDVSLFASQPYFVGLILLPEQSRLIRPLELDTGPPFALSFTESVLQRSILAHAPPSLA